MKYRYFIILLFAAFFAASPSYAAKNISDIDAELKAQEKQYQKIQSQMHKVSSNIKESKEKERHVTRELENLSRRITETQQKVNILNLQIGKVQNNIIKLTDDIHKTEKNIVVTKKTLKKRMVNIYKYGSAATYNLLMSSKGSQDAMANAYLLGKIAKQDEHILNFLRNEHRKLTIAHADLKREKSNLSAKNNDLKDQNKKLKVDSDQKTVLLGQVRKDKKLFMEQQAELMRASQEMQNAIKRLLAEKKRLREEAKRKAAEEAAKRGEKKTAIPDTPTVYYKGGRFAWPVRGEISSNFGTRVHPVFKTKVTHTGIDIRAPKGTSVTAADAGEVLYTGWMRGYGQVVIVDHGGNLTTIYAHLSKINVQENDRVTRSTVIGLVGSTGVATGNHLHFEVRVNGNAVNPMKYLK